MDDAKPFEATASRLARARREGDVAHSSELSSGASFIAASLALPMALPVAAAAAEATIAAAAHGRTTLVHYTALAVAACAPCIAGALAAVAATVASAGGVPLRAIRIDIAKLHPGAGLRRMVSRRSAVVAGRALLGASIACAILAPHVRRAFWVSTSAPMPEALAEQAVRATGGMLFSACAIAGAFGLVDLLIERVGWRRRLRMSFDEMKRDLKQSDGDPQLRQRRRAQHRALIRGSLSRLRDATFVVTNPTHVAVALEYRPPEVAVPRVLVRAADAGARVVKARARTLRIPIIEDVTLARTLFTGTDVDEPIPRSCYLAVAQIVAALLRDAVPA